MDYNQERNTHCKCTWPTRSFTQSSCYRLLDTLLVKSTCAEGPWKGCIRYAFILHAILLHGIMSLSRSRVIRCLNIGRLTPTSLILEYRMCFRTKRRSAVFARWNVSWSARATSGANVWRANVGQAALRVSTQLYLQRADAYAAASERAILREGGRWRRTGGRAELAASVRAAVPERHARQSRYRGEHRERVGRVVEKLCAAEPYPLGMPCECAIMWVLL